MKRPVPRGRGTGLEPTNRFESIAVEPDGDALDEALALEENVESRRLTDWLPDDSKSLVSENDSPDVPFRFSVNPYRGCEHGCAYCYARPSHEYLGYNAGLDFETRILVKERAPQLFRDWLCRPKYVPELVAFSGVTDCYQPLERRFRLTRRCLEVAAEARQPIGIITKNALVTRDLDVLVDLARFDAVHVMLSITTLDADLASVLEPRTSRPAARLRAVRALTEAGIPVGVMVAPIIPGLNDSEIPRILEAARDYGARTAGRVVLRLPHAVKPIFRDWLATHRPTLQPKVEARLRDVRDGELTDSQFGRRMQGTGPVAEQIAQTFDLFHRRLGFDAERFTPTAEHFRPPRAASGQMTLF